MLRRQETAQDRRGRHRDAGAHSATVESGPARAREVLLPGLRGNHAAAGAIAPDRTWARRAEAARPYPVLQVQPAPAAQSPEHHLASYAGLMQADAYAGFNRLYECNRKPGPIIEAACWAHGRRKFFDLARLNKAPIAAEAVERIDVLFAIEREINGMMPPERVPVRHERSRPLIIDLQTWLREQRTRVSKHSDTGKAIDYSLKR